MCCLDSTDPAKAELAVTASSLEDALNRFKSPGLSKPVHRGFVIGGAQLYSETLKLSRTSPASSSSASTTPLTEESETVKSGLEAHVDRILLTRVFSPTFECDVFMPEFEVEDGEKGWKQSSHGELEAWTGVEVAEGVQEENGCRYEFQMFARK
jgi:dihydrofolate reductase